MSKLERIQELLELYYENHECFISTGDFDCIPLTSLDNIKTTLGPATIHEQDKSILKKWYDGYQLYFCAAGIRVNPENSVLVRGLWFNWFNID